MTAPRQILPGKTRMITRRCSERRFLLKPSSVTSAVVGYLLAVAAARTGIQLHAFCVLSNHLHVILTDPGTGIASFNQFLNALTARALNAHHGRWDHFWESGSYSAVVLETPEDILDKCAYVLANPVAAGLVQHARDWPGLWTAPDAIGAPCVVYRRPEHFFDDEGQMPETAELRLVVPPGFASAEAFREQLVAALAEKEVAAVRQHNGCFLGRARVLAQHPLAKPRPGEPRRGLNPRIACRDRWKRIEALGRLTRFLSDYRVAWAKWCADAPDVLFPAGTYQMRVLHGAPGVGFG